MTNFLRMMNLKRLLLIAASISFCACASLSKNRFPLLDSSTALLAQQQWQITYQGEQHLMQVAIEHAPDRWQWILFNNLGQRLATATVAHQKVQIERHQSHSLNALIPEFLAALQFSYWPIVELRQSSDSKWYIEEVADFRKISFSGTLRATIHYEAASSDTIEGGWDRKLTFEDKSIGLEIVMESRLVH